MGRLSKVPLTVASDIVVARKAGRDLARALGFRAVDQTRLATAISELARNAIRHGGGGECLVEDVSQAGAVELRVTVRDQGDGIPDVEEAMADGFSTGGGLGAGLPGTRRLVHAMDIQSSPAGTTVVVRMKLGR